jgi:hypothetical protein
VVEFVLTVSITQQVAIVITVRRAFIGTRPSPSPTVRHVKLVIVTLLVPWEKLVTRQLASAHAKME